MRERTRFEQQNYDVGGSDSLLMDISELMRTTSTGKNTAMKIGEESGAKIKYGKRVLYVRKKIEEYIDSLLEV